MLRATISVLLVLSVVMLTSCGGTDGGGAGPDVTAPEVTSVSIDDGATDVGLIEEFSVTFSEAMDASTINDTTLYVAGRATTGYVEYDEATRTASFLPDTLYAVETVQELVVSDEITDEDGNPLASEHETSFTTGTLDCEHLVDRLEPNSTVVDGVVLETDRLYRTLSICSDDVEHYFFELQEPAKVTVKAQFVYAEATWRTDFERTDGVPYEAWTTGGAVTGGERTFAYSFPTGLHGVKIYSPSEPIYILYDLTLETSAPCEEDQYEDNDFREDAVPVTPGLIEDLRGCYLDPDYFSFDVTSGQTVTVTATQHTGATTCRIRIFDPAGTQTSDTEPQSPLSLSAVMTESGTCEVMAMFWGERDYDMEIVVED